MSTELEHALSGGEQQLTPEEITPEPVQEEPTPEPLEVAEVEPTPEPETPEPEQEPLARELHGIKAALTEARSELRELKNAQPRPAPQPAPDMYDDPEGYRAHQEQQYRVREQNLRLDMSEELARQAHGDDVVDAAFEALKATNDPTISASIMQARSPWGEVVKWHKAHKVQSEIGSDPDGWMKRQRAEIRAQVQAEMVAEQAKLRAATSAPSMANVTGTGGGLKSTWTGPTPLDEIIG